MNDFRRAVEARDLDAMVACLSDDVRLHSPVTFKPFEGKDAVRALFGILLEVFTEFSYTDELSGEGSHALIFSAKVGDREVQGLDLLRYGAGGLVEDFTVMVRPLSAALALRDAVGAKLGMNA